MAARLPGLDSGGAAEHVPDGLHGELDHVEQVGGNLGLRDGGLAAARTPCTSR